MKNQRMMLSCLIILILTFFMLSGCARRQANMNMGAIGDVSGSSGNARVVTFHVTGKGIAPETAINKGQAEIMAERAAIADGYRQLVEKIRGVYVDAYMKAGQGSVNYDMIRTSTQAWIRGAELDDLAKADYGIIEAHMSLRINFVKKHMIWWPAGIGQNLASGYGNTSAPYEIIGLNK